MRLTRIGKGKELSTVGLDENNFLESFHSPLLLTSGTRELCAQSKRSLESLSENSGNRRKSNAIIYTLVPQVKNYR